MCVGDGERMGGGGWRGTGTTKGTSSLGESKWEEPVTVSGVQTKSRLQRDGLCCQPGPC